VSLAAVVPVCVFIVYKVALLLLLGREVVGLCDKEEWLKEFCS
jgi:hypothetical protein